MKKTLVSGLMAFFSLLQTNVHAQTVNNGFLNMQSLGAERSAIRAERAFLHMHGEGKDEKWYKLACGYLAEFTEGAIPYKVIFDGAGRWQYTMKEYTEKELPKEVRDLVKSTFYDFSISWVKELSQYKTLVYVVHIKNDAEWKDLIVKDGEIEISHEVTL